MSRESADDAPPSSEDADPVSLRDVELEPVSLHDIERILAPGRAPPKLAAKEPEPTKPEPTKPEPREGLATTVQPEEDQDAPDSAINDLRALARASKMPGHRDHELDEVLHMGGVAPGSVMGDAPPPPLVPPDLAALVEKEKDSDKPKKPEGATKPRPRPPLKEKRAEAPAPAETSIEPPAAPIASAAPARSVKPRASGRPSTTGSTRPKSAAPVAKVTEKKEGGGGRALLYLGAAAAFLGVGYWLGTRNQAPPPTPAPPVTVVVTQRVPSEPPPAEQIDTAMAADPEPAPSASAAGPTTRAPETAAGSIPASTTTATAATPAATTAPATTTAPTPAVGEFDKGAANAALAGAVASASACKQEGDPSGQAKVQVTFAPSGKVTVANIVGPPFAGTKTGGCIAMAFRSAKVPPFTGDPVTVSKTVAIP
ncbi:MAG: hypothetical protein JNL21_02075 [Myxococcales bacterium]|nr:hypothetical protein [Myxococcales bacterium]